MHGNLPEHVNDLLVRNCDIHERSTRHNALNFIRPRYSQETVAGSSLTVHSIKECSSLPSEIRKLPSVESFKSSLFKAALNNQSLLEHFFIFLYL